MENLTKLGLGMYRMNTTNGNHIAALKAAVEEGFTLFDTAPNYNHGDSERLIGTLDNTTKSNLFFCSKVGYVVGEDRNNLKTNNNILEISKSSLYCLDRQYVRKQLEISLKRMKRDYVDTYYLHNPEYLVDNTPDYLESIKDALEELLLQVQLGKIKYIGISSNKLFNFRNKNYYTLIQELEYYFNHPSFRYLQFPFNLNESEVLAQDNRIAQLRRKYQLKFVSNRPLNTSFEDKFLRFADYSEDIKSLNPKDEESIFSQYLSKLQNKFSTFADGEIIKLPELNFLIKKRKEFENEESLQIFLENYLLPLYKKLNISFEDTELIRLHRDLVNFWRLYSKYNISKNTTWFLNSKNIEVCIDDNETITDKAVKHCFEHGIDHVLIGARKVQYIKDLKHFL